MVGVSKEKANLILLRFPLSCFWLKKSDELQETFLCLLRNGQAPSISLPLLPARIGQPAQGSRSAPLSGNWVGGLLSQLKCAAPQGGLWGVKRDVLLPLILQALLGVLSSRHLPDLTPLLFVPHGGECSMGHGGEKPWLVRFVEKLHKGKRRLWVKYRSLLQPKLEMCFQNSSSVPLGIWSGFELFGKRIHLRCELQASMKELTVMDATDDSSWSQLWVVSS